MNKKFFTFSQGNPGGFEYINSVVAEYLIVEATDVEEANDRMRKITKDFDRGCGCGMCVGERWNTLDYDEEGSEAPEINGVPAKEYRYKSVLHNDDLRTCVVHYIDGKVEYINYDGSDNN